MLSEQRDELDVKESTVELSNNSVENGEVENVEVSSETASQQVKRKLNILVRQRKGFSASSTITGQEWLETEVRSEEVFAETYEKNLKTWKPAPYGRPQNEQSSKDGGTISLCWPANQGYCRQNFSGFEAISIP